MLALQAQAVRQRQVDTAQGDLLDPLDGERRELTDMLAAADSALYYAKETGRNRTHVITATRQAS